MITWEIAKDIGGKTIKEMIELKYITVADYISENGLAAMFANNLDSYQREEEKRIEISKMINIMEKYYPNKLGEFFKEDKEKK